MKNAVAVQLLDAQREAEQLSQRKMDKQAETRFNFLMSKIATLWQGVADEGSDDPETRAREERSMLHRVLSNSGEYQTRSYAPLVSAGNDFVPMGFEKVLVESQMSAGPIFAGSPLVSNIFVTEGNPSKLPTMDDTTSTGFVVDENVAETDGVFNPSNVTLTLKKFSSGLTQYSMELAQDVEGFEGMTLVLGTALGRRISRIQNSTFLAALLTTLGSNSSASITTTMSGGIDAANVRSLCAGVNAAYRQSPKAAFLMNSNTQLYISQLNSTGGLPVFPKILSAKPELLGFPVYISDFCADVAAGSTPILFGDWSTVFIRSIQGFSIRTLVERFADIGAYAMLCRKRSAMAYAVAASSDSAIKFLTVQS